MARILVADDQPELREYLRFLLAHAGHDVIEVPNGIAALDSIRTGSIDLVISDILMPEMDGFRLCLELKRDARYRTLPFIFYTASFTDIEDVRLAENIGASAFLIKPAKPDAILMAVDGLLSGSDVSESASATSKVPGVKLFQQYGQRIERKLDQKVVELADVRTTRDMFRSLLDNLPLMVITLDTDGKRDYMNRATAEFFGVASKSEETLDLLHIAPPGEKDLLRDAVRRVLADRQPTELTSSLLRHDARSRTVHLTMLPYYGPNEEFLGVILAGVDTTEQERHKDLLLYLAEHDILTDLPNRRVLDQRFEEMLSRHEEGQACALLFIDVDHFKSINDEYGHDIGDAVLADLAHVLTNAARPDDLVVRLCGDEFVILAEGSDWDEAAVLSEVVRTSVEGASLVPTAPDRHLTVSIGIDVIPEISTPHATLRAADQAMYQAKRKGRGRVATTRDAIDETAGASGDRRTSALGERVHPPNFAPIYSLETGALMRCAARHLPQVDCALHTDEIAAVENMESRSARRITRDMIDRTLKSIADSDVRCSIRLGLADLLDATVFEYVERSASRSGVALSRLALEIPAARTFGGTLPQVWLRAADASLVEMVMTGFDVSTENAIECALAHCAELALSPQALRTSASDPGHRKAIESILRRASDAGLATIATGVDSGDLLDLAIDLRLVGAVGDALAKTASGVGEIPRRVDVGVR